MKSLLALVGILIGSSLTAAPLPPAAPIVTDAEIKAAAADVPVATIDFVVPATGAAAEEALATRFFNRPEEHRYSGLTNADWRAKWQIFSDSLVAKAKAQGLDSNSLARSLRALNRGRNRETMLWPIRDREFFPKGTPKEKIDAFEKKAEEKYRLALKEREKNPEQWYDDKFAIVPVAAYLGRHATGDCWIIVCKWELISDNEALSLGHIKVWALDTKTVSVVGYVTCD